MKIIVYRVTSILNLFISGFFFFIFIISFSNYFDKSAKLIENILTTITSISISFAFLWLTLRNYLQVFKFMEDGIWTHKGFKKYLHFKYENIKEIKIVTFNSAPIFSNGEKIIGIDSRIYPPQNLPKKWIVITDGKKNDNIYNYSSYLVPIREHMVIKLEYSSKNIDIILKHIKCDIKEITVTEEEMKSSTQKTKTL